MTCVRVNSLLLAYLMLSAASVPLAARDGDAFSIDRARLSYQQTLMLLDLVVDSELPEYIAIALDQGFAVPLMFEFEIRNHRAYWFDDKIVSLKQRYLLHYQPMLDSYVVYDVNAGERRYFGERKAAVHFVEVVYNYPLLDIGNLAPEQDYYARVRFGVDTDELPQPLKSSALWDNNWDLQSDWYEWEVVRPES
jgi:hypothetical protein